MRNHHLIAAVGTLLLAAGLIVLGSASVMAQDDATPEPLSEPPYLADYYFAWAASPHADASAEAFTHWDAEGEIPATCAKCHASSGYLDYLGADGSEARVVDTAAPLGSVVTCDTCHNPVASELTNVVFPSGVEVTDDSESTRCMVCHQGQASGDSVDAAIAEAGLSDDLNAVNPELGFVNIHYYAAAASLYGSVVHGGYEYDGLVYQMKNDHVPGFNTCASCHDPHTTTIQVESCATCHDDVETVEDLRFIRMPGSGADYDGDDDTFEGIAEEIETLQELLYEAIQAYAGEVVGTPIVYDAHAYPYFFADTNDNGEVDEGEAAFPNAYKAFTGNLLRAAYNYQVTMKDPGGYAHNAQYHIHLLYDSIASLNEQLSDPIDMEFAERNSPGHFNVTAEAFRHWDADGEVPGTCARCHTAEGLPFYLDNAVNIAAAPSNSLNCATCHDDLTNLTLFAVDAVTFPSGAEVSFGEGDENNLCMTCHQGRESTVSVNNAINRAGVGPDEVSTSLTFRNVHYFAAGATLFGADAQGAYQFDGKEYNGRFWHDGEEATTCASCHDPHTGENDINLCEDCHDDVSDPEDVRLIRMLDDVELIDYDGDGDDEEPIADEIASFHDALLTALYAYAQDTAGTAIVYDAHSHPYWFIDTNANGTADADEVNGDNRFTAWTPNLLRAAYNYQFVAKDPGAFAHNADYVMQVLYDSLEAIGGADAVADFTRPPVQASGE